MVGESSVRKPRDNGGFWQPSWLDLAEHRPGYSDILWGAREGKQSNHTVTVVLRFSPSRINWQDCYYDRVMWIWQGMWLGQGRGLEAQLETCQGESFWLPELGILALWRLNHYFLLAVKFSFLSFFSSGRHCDELHRQLNALNIVMGLILFLPVSSDKDFNDVTAICSVISV